MAGTMVCSKYCYRPTLGTSVPWCLRYLFDVAGCPVEEEQGEKYKK